MHIAPCISFKNKGFCVAFKVLANITTRLLTPILCAFNQRPRLPTPSLDGNCSGQTRTGAFNAIKWLALCSPCIRVLASAASSRLATLWIFPMINLRSSIMYVYVQISSIIFFGQNRKTPVTTLLEICTDVAGNNLHCILYSWGDNVSCSLKEVPLYELINCNAIYSWFVQVVKERNSCANIYSLKLWVPFEAKFSKVFYF